MFARAAKRSVGLLRGGVAGGRAVPAALWARPMVTLPVPPGRKEQAAKRPLSPHLEVYKFGINMITSVMTRGTGMFLWGGVSASAIVLAMSSGGADAYLDFIHSMPALKPVVKFGIAFPLIYHFGGGIRHMMWDHVVGNDPKDVEFSAKVLLATSTALSLYAAFAEMD